MSGYSIKNISKLPVVRPSKFGGFARSLMFKMFSNIKVGSLTLREDDQNIVFGNRDVQSEPHAEVIIHDPGVYKSILTGGSIAAGETFIEGAWSSADLTEVTRTFSANLSILEAMSARQNFLTRMALKLGHWGRKNTSEKSRQNIAAHYDLGNEFFSLFLDAKMMYSSAVFPDGCSNLAEASENKLRLICEDLELRPEDHLVEIGAGWGGMAIFAAEHYGCHVTTTTISKEQLNYVKGEIIKRGLEKQITVLFDDYRDLAGSFDKLVSIEMIEAVGHHFYDTYFQQVSRLLKPHGKALIQAITVPEQRYQQARDSVDFIKRYIFPGGCLPSVSIINLTVARMTDMQMSGLRDITRDYANTLSAWHDRFLKSLDQVEAMGYDEQFIRMWRYYLSYCEGGFRERIIGTYQITLTKPLYRPT